MLVVRVCKSRGMHLVLHTPSFVSMCLDYMSHKPSSCHSEIPAPRGERVPLPLVGAGGKGVNVYSLSREKLWEGTLLGADPARVVQLHTALKQRTARDDLATRRGEASPVSS